MYKQPKSLKTRVFSLFLVFTITFGFISLGIGENSTSVQAQTTEEKIAAVAKERDALASKLKQAKADKAALATQKDEAQSNLAFLNQRSEEQKKLYEEAVSKQESALKAVDSAMLSYQMAMDNFKKKSDEYGKRISQMSRVQQKSVLEIFLSSGSLDGFFTTMQIMKYVNDADERALRSLERSEKLAAESKQQADGVAAESKKTVAECSAIIDQIKSDSLKAEASLAEYSSKLKKLIADADSMEVKKSEADQKIDNLKQASSPAAPSPNNPYTGGRFVWPAPGYYQITSEFGYRVHPIFGATAYHSGIDIAAPSGKPIVAAADGVVTRASWFGGFGNLVEISHGNGLVTKYAHMSSIGTSNGAQVKAGQVVGYVGSTGWSTGPHLHFQVEVNGTEVNPLLYLN